MTDDDITRLAQEAELAAPTDYYGERIVAGLYQEDVDLMPYLRRFAEAVRAHTLEVQPGRIISDAESDDHIRRLREQSDILAGPWLPIETAPKDGTFILLGGGTWGDDFHDEAPRVVVGWWDIDHGWVTCNAEGGFATFLYHDPTHWMPVPDGPTPPLQVVPT